MIKIYISHPSSLYYYIIYRFVVMGCLNSNINQKNALSTQYKYLIINHKLIK